MANDKYYYWLGHATPSAQDHFFIDALDKNIWAQGSEEQWDTCWLTNMPDEAVFEQLTPQKTINHIPGNNSLTIKSCLYETLTEARQRAAGTEQALRYNFFPKTYSMPEDYFSYLQDAMENPQQLWIQKPKNLSRGRGIEMVQHPSTVPLSSEWIIQHYINSPHLYDGHKYVLRCYVLITSVEPLCFYLYKEGFAKLASETYSEDDLNNPYRHLTNPDINEENTRIENAVTFFSFHSYRQWLRSQGHDDNQLFDELKDLITLTVIAAREKMRRKSQEITADTTGCYELIGLDCMVDEHLKPWILECNLSPSLSTYADTRAGADDELKIKRQLIKDLVSIIGLNKRKDAPQETPACGDFECLFPTIHANHYLKCFPVPRYQDILSVPNEVTIDLKQIHLRPRQGSEHVFSDSLALCTQKTATSPNEFLLPNEIALWIWIKNAEGLVPNAIAEELQNLVPKPDGCSEDSYRHQLLQQIWDVLSDWSHAGIFDRSSESQNENQNEHEDTSDIGNQSFAYLVIGGSYITLNCECAIAKKHLQPLLSSRINTSLEPSGISIDILPSCRGYHLITEKKVLAMNLGLSELPEAIFSLYYNHEKNTHNTCAVQANIISSNEKHFLVIDNRSGNLDFLCHQLSENDTHNHLSSAVLLNTQAGIVSAIHAPLRLPLSLLGHCPEATDTTVGQYQDVYCHLKPLTMQSQKNIYIDNIILIEPAGEGSSRQAQKLSNAEVLVKLWQHRMSKSKSLSDKGSSKDKESNKKASKKENKSASLEKLLPKWVNNINAVKFEIDDMQASIEAVSDFINKTANLKDKQEALTGY